jgi:pimeloyl-ACP methyl ester carboxylesterase/DNA-binding CsgD family transcriptional regulator
MPEGHALPVLPDASGIGATEADIDGLVRLVYQCAIEPIPLTDFIDAVRAVDSRGEDERLLSGVSSHAGLAAQLAEREIPRTRSSHCSIIVNATLMVRDMDQDARHELEAFFPDLRPGATLQCANDAVTVTLAEAVHRAVKSPADRHSFILHNGARQFFGFMSQSEPGWFRLSLLRNGLRSPADTADSFLDGFLTDLTDMERRVCLALFQGASPPAIARLFAIAPNTVKGHLKAVFSKLGVNRQIDLVRLLDQALLLERELEDPERGPALDRKRSIHPESKSIRLPDGRALSYRDYGPRSGKPVVFVHGGYSSGRLPSRDLPALERLRLRIIAMDRPGFGGSDAAPAPSVEGFAADAAFVLDRLKPGPARLLAYAKGSLFGLALAKARPDLINRVYLCSFSDGERNATGTPGNRIQFAERILKRRPALAATLLRLFVLSRPHAAFVDHLRKLWSVSVPDRLAVEDEGVQNDLAEMLEEALSSGVDGPVGETIALGAARLDLSNLVQPVVAWHGADDPICPATRAREALGVAPDLRFIQMPDRGQLMFFQDLSVRLAEIAGD